MLQRSQTLCPLGDDAAGVSGMTAAEAFNRTWHKSLAHFAYLLLTLLSGLQPVSRRLFNFMRL